MDTERVYLPDISAVSDIINEAQFNCTASLRVKKVTNVGDYESI